jgi:hypothetical protein
MSCASLPDTDCASRQHFYVWPAMLGDSLSIVKELTPSGRASNSAVDRPNAAESASRAVDCEPLHANPVR